MRKQVNKLVDFIKSHIVSYGTPNSLNYVWSFGALAGVMLVVQIISGLLISMHYSSDIDLAYSSVIEYTRNSRYGWAVRATHANGATFFFIVVYFHILKALYYGSYFYPRQKVWYSGLIMFILMMATAFIGYVLPWGQMSYWGATVITSLFTSIPFIGEEITVWLWGGYSVGSSTLQRFATLHYTLPWLIVGMTGFHLAELHKVSSNNPIGGEKSDIAPFSPYYGLKDLHSVLILFFFLALVVTFIPNFFGHPDNFIPADPFVTPKHIVPEWYFLPFYAILRSIPHKTGGILAMAGSLLVLFLLPSLTSAKTRNSSFRPIFAIILGFFTINFALLGWIGQMPVETPYEEYGLYFTIFYFVFLMIILPLMGRLEKVLLFFGIIKEDKVDDFFKN